MTDDMNNLSETEQEQLLETLGNHIQDIEDQAQEHRWMAKSLLGQGKGSLEEADSHKNLAEFFDEELQKIMPIYDKLRLPNKLAQQNGRPAQGSLN